MKQSALYLIECPAGRSELLARLTSYLHPEVRHNLHRYRTADKRNQTILGRALLGVALFELGVEFDLSNLGYMRNGSPCVPSGFFGSISHTDGVVGAVASQTGPIGLDIEHRWQSFEQLAGIISIKECNHHISTCDCTLRDWVAVEATAKASGRPLSELLEVMCGTDDTQVDGTWRVGTIEVAEGVFAAVANRSGCHVPTMVWLTLRDLSNFVDRSNVRPLRKNISHVGVNRPGF